jgi:hypothetical protein
MNQMKDWFPRTHWEPRYGTPKEASDYCKKEGMWRERGTMGLARDETGKGNAAAHWANIIDAIRSKATWRDVILDPELAQVVSRCLTWARNVYDTRPYHFRPLDIRADGYRYQARIDLFLRNIEPEDSSHYDDVGVVKFHNWIQYHLVLG